MTGAVVPASPRPVRPGARRRGADPHRVTYAEAGDERNVLVVLEDGLCHAGLAAVVGEVSGLAMAASQRFQLAAEEQGTTAFVVRRWATPTAAADTASPRPR